MRQLDNTKKETKDTKWMNLEKHKSVKKARRSDKGLGGDIQRWKKKEKEGKRD